MQNSNWSQDELIIATQFYKRYAPSIPGKTKEELILLADEIRAIATSLGLSGDHTFRNADGVYMKLMELRKYDANYNGKGLGRKLRSIEQEVWDLSDDRLEKAAKRVREALLEVERGDTPILDEPEIADAVEGALVTRIHRQRERNQKIVRDKKQFVLKAQGFLECEVCSFDFQKMYGERGQSFIECHHTIPVSDMAPGAKTKMKDLSLICANCHRMIHAKKPWLTIDELKLLIKSG